MTEAIRKTLETEDDIEAEMKELFGGLDAEEKADLQRQKKETQRAREQRLKKEAQQILRRVGRPVKCQDMLAAMQDAIATKMDIFERERDVKSALYMLAIVICKNILTDGPLHEGN